MNDDIDHMDRCTRLDCLCATDAQATEELKSENARLREALERIVDSSPSMGRPPFTPWELRDIARQALGEQR